MILKKQEKDGVVKALYNSSNILASTYDESNNLTIIFKSGSTYKYIGVSKTDYMRFELAESQGGVFNTHIKKYAFEKLDSVDVSNIISEADNIQKDTDNLILKAKKQEVVNKISHCLYVSEGSEPNDDLFISALIKMKEVIDDFITYKNNLK